MILAPKELPIPLMEAFYGKPKEFEIIERELDKIIKIIKDHSTMDGDKIRLDPMTDVIAESKSVDIIEREFAKFFKLKKFYLCIYTSFPLGVLSRPSMNAFTFGKAFNFLRPKVSSKRVDSTDLVVGINVDAGFIRYTDMTAQELMAFILHEVGHNMDASVGLFLSSIPTNIVDVEKSADEQVNRVIAAFINMALEDLVFANLSLFNKKLESILEKTPMFRPIMYLIADINESISAFKYISPKLTSNAFKFLINGGILSALTPRNIFGYSAEKYADSFATAYGYGPHLATALAKFEILPGVKSVEIIKTIPMLNIGYDLLKVTSQITFAILDEHPQTPSRILAQLDKLKRDAKDPKLDPRVKKELDANIKELEDFINNKYLNIKDNENKRAIFTWFYNYTAIKLFKGNIDPREVFKLFDIEE